jgi:hypothetical protein
MNHDQSTAKSARQSVTVSCASAHLSDEAFMTRLAAGRLPIAHFRHADHLRLAWICLRQAPFHEALTRVRATIQAYAAAIGATGLYHETITRAWLHLVASHDEASFEDFLRLNADRLVGNPLKRFYSEQLLKNESARQTWVAPDLQPLPARATNRRSAV